MEKYSLSASNTFKFRMVITFVGISIKLLSLNSSSEIAVDADNSKGICVKQLLQKFSVSRDFIAPISARFFKK